MFLFRVEAQIADSAFVRKRAAEEYPELAARFAVLDTTLGVADLQVLYSGFVYRDEYKPDKIIETENRIREFNNSGQPAKALLLADSLLKHYPVSIVALFEKSFACAALNRLEEEFESNTKYKAILRTIIKSGDGRTFETAYVINTPNDEFDIIRYSGFTADSYQEIGYNGKTYDVLTLKKNKQKQERVFFDISAYASYKERQKIESLK
jgi:hypothetical protein